MDYKPSLRNVISTAQEYLTFVENCPPFAAAPGVFANADLIRKQITDYNAEVHAGKGKNPGQLAFEDRHAKLLMQSLNQSRQMTYNATMNPALKDLVVDGGGSEWNRVNPLKLTNHLRDLSAAEAKGVSRSPSAYHCDGPMEYEAHGGHGVLKKRNMDQTLSRVQLPAASAPAAGMRPKMGA
jgi:hypothetical protein